MSDKYFQLGTGLSKKYGISLLHNYWSHKRQTTKHKDYNDWMLYTIWQNSGKSTTLLLSNYIRMYLDGIGSCDERRHTVPKIPFSQVLVGYYIICSMYTRTKLNI